MASTTTDLLLVAALLGGMALFGIALLLLVLRVGPKRGTWNQPAAALRRPGRVTFGGVYALAIAHVLLGIGIALRAPGNGTAMLVLLVVVACFYVLLAHSYSLATRVTRRSEHHDDAPAPQA